MVAVISGTNREESVTRKIAAYCENRLKEQGVASGMIDLCALNGLTLAAHQFSSQGMDERVLRMRDDILVPSEHWILVLPEYNGSYPGVVKWWIDLLSVKNRSEVFRGKTISLLGVASGRAGNIRGLDDITGVLHYLGMIVLPNKLPISKVEEFFTEGKILQPSLSATLDSFVDESLHYALQLR